MWEWSSRAWSRGKGSRLGGRFGVREKADWKWVEGVVDVVVVVAVGIGGRVE